MKIGLIIPGNLWFCPYVHIYTRILDDHKVEYDIISWNRDGSESPGETVFNLNVNTLKRYQKITPFLKYRDFIKEILKKKKYQKIIVFGPQLGLLLYHFIKNNYKNNFILDYRDLSIEQLPILKMLYKKVLKISSLNVISSIGFKKFLPDNKYTISHNFSSEIFSEKSCPSSKNIPEGNCINILTIGSIRDYESNLEVMKALANKKNIKIFFVGKGYAAEMLEHYAEEHHIENVDFHGYYKKLEEARFIRDATFLNIYYPQIKSHSSAMSNRFYNGLRYKRPMIVTSNSIQGDFVEQYNLGIVLKNCEDLERKLNNYISNFDYRQFDGSTEKLLKVFEADYDDFYNKVSNFIRS